MVDPESSGDEDRKKMKMNHPFLIVKKEQFQELRAKAAKQGGGEPWWKSMKDDAISRSEAGVRENHAHHAHNLQDYIGAAALAYILDDEKVNAQVQHAHRVRDVIQNDYSQLVLLEGNWGKVVPNMGSFFVAILALDIVYNDLTETEIQFCEQIIEQQISKISRKGSWEDIRRGTHGTWDIYKGLRRTKPDDDYYNSIMSQITDDGVSTVTIHYAWERLGGGDSRIAKSAYMDVLEFTGIDNRYYGNARLQKFYRWLFGSSLNCSKEMAIIGDMLPSQSLKHDMLHLRVVNFGNDDEEAAGYAAWFWEGAKQPPKGHILTYILPRKALPPPITPSSKIYPNGGAFFREIPDDPNGLHVVLYNIKSQDEYHTHNEVNGLAFSGFGNRLLVNGGRLGPPVRPAPFNNTLTINGQNHNSRTGGGILEGFTSTKTLDYASGCAGNALGSVHKHERNIVLVHASADDGVNAYCVLLDEVHHAHDQPTTPTKVHTFFHPANESTVKELRQNQEYEAVIDHKETKSGAILAFYFATPAMAVKIEKVPSAVPARYPDYPDHNRLEAIYNTDRQGSARIISILYPYHTSQQSSKASFTRIVGPKQQGTSSYTGARIDHTHQVKDYMFESSGDQLIQITQQQVSFQAKAVLYRKVNDDELTFYFVRKGRSFRHHHPHNNNNSVGFISEKPISIYLHWSHDGGNHGNTYEGAIISPPGTTSTTWLTLICPNASSLNFEPRVNIVSSSSDSIVVDLAEGNYRIYSKTKE